MTPDKESVTRRRKVFDKHLLGLVLGETELDDVRKKLGEPARVLEEERVTVLEYDAPAERSIARWKKVQFIFFDDDSKTGIAFISSDGNLKISLNETNSEIHISSQGKVHVQSQKDMTLESQANLNLKAGQGLKLEAGTDLKMKGSSGASLEGGSQVEVKASGQLKITGAMVDVNSGALQVM